MLGTIECYGLDLYLLTSVNGKLHPDGAADHRIALGIDIYIDVEITFLLVISLYDVCGCLCHIFGKLSASAKIQSFEKFLFLSALHTAECPARNTGPFNYADLEEGCIP